MTGLGRRTHRFRLRVESGTLELESELQLYLTVTGRASATESSTTSRTTAPRSAAATCQRCGLAKKWGHEHTVWRPEINMVEGIAGRNRQREIVPLSGAATPEAAHATHSATESSTTWSARPPTPRAAASRP